MLMCSVVQSCRAANPCAYATRCENGVGCLHSLCRAMTFTQQVQLLCFRQSAALTAIRAPCVALQTTHIAPWPSLLAQVSTLPPHHLRAALVLPPLRAPHQDHAHCRHPRRGEHRATKLVKTNRTVTCPNQRGGHRLRLKKEG